jgi:hypothetical protein
VGEGREEGEEEPPEGVERYEGAVEVSVMCKLGGMNNETYIPLDGTIPAIHV